MSILNLGRLDNLQELEHLRNLREMNQLNRLEDLERLEYLEQLENLGQLQKMDNLDSLQNLEQLDHLEHLPELEQLNQLQNLDLLNRLQSLEQLQRIDHLQQLDLLQRLEELNKLQNLQSLNSLNHLENLNRMEKLGNLDELRMLQKLGHLNELKDLGHLRELEKLSVLDRTEGLDTTTALFFIASMIAPGVIYQEAFSLFGERRLKFRHAMVLMLFYNVLNMFLCVQFIYSYVTNELLARNAFYFYASWFIVLLLLPFALGWLSAVVTNRCLLGKAFKEIMYANPAQTVSNSWERFLTGAERYEMLVTMNTEEKIKGFFQRGESSPESSDPNDLYLTETSLYDPRTLRWEQRDPSVSIWVRGSEIKTVEVSPQSRQTSC